MFSLVLVYSIILKILSTLWHKNALFLQKKKKLFQFSSQKISCKKKTKKENELKLKKIQIENYVQIFSDQKKLNYKFVNNRKNLKKKRFLFCFARHLQIK